jgi:hypothetical protein
VSTATDLAEVVEALNSDVRRHKKLLAALRSQLEWDVEKLWAPSNRN